MSVCYALTPDVGSGRGAGGRAATRPQIGSKPAIVRAMAKLLSGDDFPATDLAKDRYPAAWFDGKWRLLEEGEDFPAGKLVESAARKFRKEAGERGLKGQAVIINSKSFRARAH